MTSFRMFEERAAEKGHSCSLTEAQKYTEEFETNLVFNYSDLSISSRRKSGAEVKPTKIKEHLRNALTDKLQDTIKSEKWHGSF